MRILRNVLQSSGMLFQDYMPLQAEVLLQTLMAMGKKQLLKRRKVRLNVTEAFFTIVRGNIEEVIPHIERFVVVIYDQTCNMGEVMSWRR